MAAIWMDLNSSVKIPSYRSEYYLAAILVAFIVVNSFALKFEGFSKFFILPISIGCVVAWVVICVPLAIWWHTYLGGSL
jgi:hypothetical protein